MELSKLEERNLKKLLYKETQYERQIASTIKKSLDEVRIEISKIYEKYAVDGKLTKAQLMQYGRLSSIETNLMSKLDPVIKASLSKIKRIPTELYGEAYFSEAWAIDQVSELRLGWGVLNKDIITETLDNTFFSSAVNTYRSGFLKAIRAAMATGLANGKPFQDMVKDLAKVWDMKGWELLRIIRTEGMSAINAGQSDAYTRAKANGIELDEIWDATLDGKTRPTHQQADGTKKDENGYFYVGGEKARYPADENLTAGERCNCRCRIRAEILGYPPQLRRDKENGIIPYQTYEDWATNNIKWHKSRKSKE
jgi:hypothetical protein